MADSVRAWHPEVPQLQEVLHATFAQHSYPTHVHDSWTVLVVDDGAVVYDLDRSGHHAVPATVTLLPPHVPHDGRSALGGVPFRKRVLYLEQEWLPAAAVGAAVRAPTVTGRDAVAAVAEVHRTLREPADVLAVEVGLLALGDVLRGHLGDPPPAPSDSPLARRLRELLDDRLTESFTMTEAARALGAHRGHLVRVFTRAYGIPPHHYVTGRRVDRARRLLLAGRPAAQAAVEAGFHDQSHLTRHFRRVLGVTPGAFRV